MNTQLGLVKSFLEDAHKTGTDCKTAEFYLTLAKETLQSVKNEEEKTELITIIAELEQMHNVCSCSVQNEEDDSECGV